jgi:ABC-2 type transport system ATP-binding protein
MSSTPSPAIEANKLVKRFGDLLAVDELSIEIPAGKIFGLLGPNASGKSTTIRLLSGIMSPDAGTATVLGFRLRDELEEIRKNIGYVAQDFALYPELTVAENLRFYGAIYGHNDAAQQRLLLSRFGLDTFRARRAETLSGGYKRRLSIACALIHDPKLIFLDEPTAGIDPITRKDLWEGFYELASEGKTLFVTTHYMEEAERCNRLPFIHHGRFVADGTPAEIKASLTDNVVYACRSAYRPELARDLRALHGVHMLNQFGDELRIIAEQQVQLQDFAATLSKHGLSTEQMIPVLANIEDVFVALTGQDS